MKLVLFDIDGTLLLTDGAGRAAIQRALLDEMGTTGPIDTVRFDGKTDPQIVMELMRAAEHPEAEDPDRIEAVCARYVALLEIELAERPRPPRLLPGVNGLLDALDTRTDVLVGLLTGNVRGGAALKLGAAGLAFERFRVGAFGSDAAARSDLPSIAARRAAALLDHEPTGAQVVIIGDTPADVTCGDGIGARAIGVATGAYERHDLDRAGAYAAVEDLADTDRVVDLIFT